MMDDSQKWAKHRILFVPDRSGISFVSVVSFFCFLYSFLAPLGRFENDARRIGTLAE
jgi:hypothetical protein